MTNINQNMQELPEPSSLLQQQTQRFLAWLQQRIDQAGGKITFAEYMQHALYHPEFGYYMHAKPKFGQQGDFVTAPEISALFSQCLARQVAQVLENTAVTDIVEFGAGTGVMAYEILQTLIKLKVKPKNYYILEISPELQKLQQQRLSGLDTDINVIWLNSLDDLSLNAIILANEILDAFPVELFKVDETALLQAYVMFEDNKLETLFSEKLSDDFSKEVEALRKHYELTAPYLSEVNLQSRAWLKSIKSCLQQGVIFLIDYGFPGHEYYFPGRNMGTLMCHYQHLAHENPLLFPGLQDITAHVDFTAIAEQADELGLEIAGFSNQANFLINCGITESMQELPENEYFDVVQKVKTLLMPGEMGEIIKVLALISNLDLELLGFKNNDQRHRL